MKQLCNLIETNNIYSSTQAGYRRNHSTNTILIQMRDDILNAMNKCEVTLPILADFSKAFDTVDYTVLIKKLSKLNMSPKFLHHNAYKSTVINLVTKKSILVYLKTPYWVPYCSTYMLVT